MHQLISYFTKLSILQLVELIHTHMTSYCSKLSILQLVGLICTHLTSCCTVGAIYYTFWFCKTALVLVLNCTFAPIFKTLHVCPCFLNSKLAAAPILWNEVNVVNWRLKRQIYPWHKWPHIPYGLAYMDHFWSLF
jgi:hypothetical protein